jgi:hypothetical protein
MKEENVSNKYVWTESKTIYRWEKRQKEGRLTVTKRKIYERQKLDPEELK